MLTVDVPLRRIVSLFPSAKVVGIRCDVDLQFLRIERNDSHLSCTAAISRNWRPAYTGLTQDSSFRAAFNLTSRGCTRVPAKSALGLGCVKTRGRSTVVEQDIPQGSP